MYKLFDVLVFLLIYKKPFVKYWLSRDIKIGYRRGIWIQGSLPHIIPKTLHQQYNVETVNEYETWYLNRDWVAH